MLFSTAVGVLVGLLVPSAIAAPALDRIKLPPGFKISLYAEGIPSARGMTRGDDGTVYVGSWSGSAYALPDADRDHRADKVIQLISGLNTAIGVAWRKNGQDGDLYIGEIHRVIQLKNVQALSRATPEVIRNTQPSVVRAGLPRSRHHGARYIAFGPDGWLYVGMGAPCNVCEQANPLSAIIARIKPDGSLQETYASGVRNTVGFDWHPVTKELWFTDNGRDMLGDDIPPDELNHAPRAGLHFGFPYCLGNGSADPQFGKGRNCSDYQKAALPLPAHVASLGMKFYRGSMFPAEYRNQIFIAEHGSWNRSQPIGYRISLARRTADGTLRYEPFASGWLSEQGRTVMGRPVDLLEMPDGSLLVSDDRAGVIYRISYAAASR